MIKSSHPEVHQLKQLLNFYKSKYEKSKEEGKDEEITSLTQQLSTLKEYYQNHQKEIQKLKAENDQLKQLSLQDLPKQKEELTSQLKTAQESYKELSEEAHRHIFEYEKQLKEYQADVLHLKQEVLEKTHLIQELKEQVKTNEEWGELKKNYQQSLKRIKEEEKIRHELDWKTQNLGLEVAEVKKSYQQSLDTIQNLEVSLRLLKTERDNFSSKLQQAQSLTPVLTSAQSQIEDLQSQLEDARLQNTKEKQKIEKLAHLIKERDIRINELQQIEASLRRTSDRKIELEHVLEKTQGEHHYVLEQKTTMEKELLESRQHAEQLERVIQFLRERLQEAQLELKELHEEFNNSQEMSKKLNDLLQQGIREKTETQGEIDALHTQFATLKQQLEHIEHELKEKTVLLEENRIQKEKFFTEKQLLEVKLDDKAKTLEIFERELALIKQTLVRALKEAKEIEEHYRNTVKEKVTVMAKLHQAQQQLEVYREQEKSLKNQLEHSLNQINMADEETRHLIDRCKRVESEGQQKEEMILKLKKEIGIRNDEILLWKNQEQELKNLVVNLEEEMKKAQQHLAKKVKELTVLEDKQEGLNQTIVEQQKNITQGHIRLAEVQTTLDLQIQQQKRLEEQLNEAVKALETQQNKWEEKYFSIYEKWQTSDVRLRELEKLEEKHKQLQGLLSNLGTFMGESSMQAPLTQEFQKPIPKADSTKVLEQKNPYQNLFDIPKAPTRSKSDLLTP